MNSTAFDLLGEVMRVPHGRNKWRKTDFPVNYIGILKYLFSVLKNSKKSKTCEKNPVAGTGLSLSVGWSKILFMVLHSSFLEKLE